MIEFDTKGNDYAQDFWTVSTNAENEEVYSHDKSDIVIYLKFEGEDALYRITSAQGQMSAGHMLYRDMESFKNDFIFQGNFWKTFGKMNYY
jgi:hypothetical protein